MKVVPWPVFSTAYCQALAQQQDIEVLGAKSLDGWMHGEMEGWVIGWLV